MQISEGKMSTKLNVKGEFKPLIVAFCCNWCSYAGADLAGTSDLLDLARAFHGGCSLCEKKDRRNEKENAARPLAAAF